MTLPVVDRYGNRVPVENPDRGKANTYGTDRTDDTAEDIARGAIKYDGDKHYGGILYEYFPRALTQVSEVSSFGARKYSRGGWANVPNGIERYKDAMHRHLLQEAAGEVFDQDSKLRHAAHAAWGALCILELTLREEETK